MNHKHRKVLHALYAHPASANISARAVESVLKEMGAEIEQRHGGRWGVRLNEHFVEISHKTHSFSPMQVRQMAKFIKDAGIDAERDYPL
ncbi:MAG: hypothetical protein JKY32_12940 [Rhizobiales bacterium]|nr:hypothetical protein [Hyphomicrobiales bacterium]